MDTNDAFEPQSARLPLQPDFSDEDQAGMLVRAKQLCAAASAVWEAAKWSTQPAPAPAKNLVPDNAVFNHIESLLHEYDISVVQNPQQIRNFCINILVQKAATAKSDAAQLRAVEMLGKVKDVSLFEERSTVLVEHMTTDELKAKLREKFNKLRGDTTDAIDVQAKQV